MIDTTDWWSDFIQNMADRFVPVEKPEPGDMPDTPVFPPPDEVHIMPPLLESDWAWQIDLRAYHSHLCPCPDCAEAESRRNPKLLEHLRKSQQW